MSSSYAYPQARSSTHSHTKNASVAADQIKEKLGNLLGTNKQDLPLYKDKPHNHAKSRNIVNIRFLRGRRRGWLILVVILFALWWLGSSIISSLGATLGATEVSWIMRRNMVRKAFITSWEDYAKYAWGKDVYSPISHKSSFIISRDSAGKSVNSGVGWIIADALDTAILMDCPQQVMQARKWIQASLDFSKIDNGINTFETTIRVLGGLLSAHYLSTSFPHLAALRNDDRGQKGEDLYIEKAVDLADRLLGAFDTPTGIPFVNINLNTSRGMDDSEMEGVSAISEAGTVQLELKYLAKITGEPYYWTTAERVVQAIDALKSQDGLVPMFIDHQTGKVSGLAIRVGARADSYYEYLIKQYLQTGETIYKEMWDEALEGIKRHLITWSPVSNFTVLAERPEGLSGALKGRMDHLACFLPGVIALGTTGGRTVDEAKKYMGSAWGAKEEENLVLAQELMNTCWGMYMITPTGLSPETVHLKVDDPPRRWKFDDANWKQPRSSAKFEDLKSTAYKLKTAVWRDDYEIQGGDLSNLQRPETVESLYYLWRITGNSIYREWGWRIFKSFLDYTKVVDRIGQTTGYTSLDDVMQIPPKQLGHMIAGINVAQQMANQNTLHFDHDQMEGFWMSETLKYLYLLFSDETKDEWFDLKRTVVNSEGHIFPRFDVAGHSVFKTGWSRNSEATNEVL